MSLRLRLVAGLATLVIAGLAVFGTVTYLSVNHYVLGRLDRQLVDASHALTTTGAAGGQGGGFGPGPGDRGPGFCPGEGSPPSVSDEALTRNAAGPELFVDIYSSRSGLTTVPPSRATTAPKGVAPKLPGSVMAAISAGHAAAGSPTNAPVSLYNLPPASGPGPVERVAVSYPRDGVSIVVAASLDPVRQTVRRLLMVEIGVGLGVLGLTVGLGLALSRQATRPLEEIAATADAIAAGDMDRRVAPGREGSETGRVARALNAMLEQIQEAFGRRDATEARLRAFVADASHELSTPLTSIRGYAELFERGLKENPEDLAKALERIQGEAARMGTLVDELLTLASFDAGRPLGRDPVDLRAIAADAAADLRAVDPSRTVELEAPSAVIVVGDEARLRQVASNLISNVRRHTPPGSGVTIRARAGGERGVLEVADRGPGMTDEQAAKVFDRFYRVDKARSRAMGGAGLGLSIVAAIAEAHGGGASVSSSVGQGTTFAVAIPLARAPAED